MYRKGKKNRKLWKEISESKHKTEEKTTSINKTANSNIFLIFYLDFLWTASGMGKKKKRKKKTFNKVNSVQKWNIIRVIQV